MPRWYRTADVIKMKKHLILFSTLVLFVFCSCTKITLSGNNITKGFDIEGPYTELYVENAFDVVVSDTATQVYVTTDENVMPHVVVEKDGDKLKIYLKPMTINIGMDLDVILPYNADLNKVKLSGASDFHSVYGLYAQHVEVELSGASDFECDIAADAIEMVLSGASDIKGHVIATDLDLKLSGASDALLEGQVATLKIDLSGASSIKKKIVEDRYALVCDRCEGLLSGASHAYIHCDGQIEVVLSGASDLHYTGDATTSGSTVSGGSDIEQDIL